MSFTPTIVVGIGGAGRAMATAVAKRAREEQVSDRVRALRVDTEQGSPTTADADSTPLTDANALVLDIESDRWQDARDRRQYIGSAHELPSQGGTARQRPIGRYCVDTPSGLERTWTFLEDHVTEFVAGLEGSVGGSAIRELNVWVVNSLSGGTGSGAFPLVAGLLEELLTELEAERSLDTTLRGVGSLLRLDRLAEQLRVPEGPLGSYINAYTALSELQPMLDEESELISLHPDADQFVRKVVDVSGAFDRYFLIGAREREREYLQSLNETVADTIYYLGVSADIEMGESTRDRLNETRLCSIDGAAIEFPVETANEFVTLDEAVVTKRREIDRLEHDDRELTEDRDYLREILELGHEELPTSESPVDRQLVRHCYAEARRVDPGEFLDRIDGITSYLREEFGPPQDREFDPTSVVRYLLLRQRVATLARKRERTREDIEELAATILDTYHDSLQQYLDEESLDRVESDPLTALDDLERFLKDTRSNLIERCQETLDIIVDPFGDLRERIERLDRYIDELERLQSTYRRRRRALGQVDEIFEKSRDALTDVQHEIERDCRELADRIARYETDLEVLKERRERLASELEDGDHSVDHHHTRLAVERPDLLESGVLERANEEGFAALIEADVIDREELETTIEKVCLARQEPIQDLPIRLEPVGVLAPIIAEENATEWMDHVVAAGKDAGFPSIGPRVDTADTLSIRLLGLYVGVNLEATSEFGTLDEYAGPDGDLNDLFGPQGPDTIDQFVAYPELW